MNVFARHTFVGSLISAGLAVGSLGYFASVYLLLAPFFVVTCWGWLTATEIAALTGGWLLTIPLVGVSVSVSAWLLARAHLVADGINPSHP
jgi:hypothetical protein